MNEIRELLLFGLPLVIVVSCVGWGTIFRPERTFGLFTSAAQSNVVGGRTARHVPWQFVLIPASLVTLVTVAIIWGPLGASITNRLAEPGAPSWAVPALVQLAGVAGGGAFALWGAGFRGRTVASVLLIVSIGVGLSAALVLAGLAIAHF